MSPVEGDEAADLAAATAGDEAAFARIYDRLGPVVLAICRKHAPGEAEDATQECFIRAWRRLHKVDGPQRLRPWLFAIARRVCSERRRAARRRRGHEEAFALSRASGQPAAAAAESGDPAGRSARTEQLAQLESALDRLDDRQRLAIHLYYLEADPVQAASSALGLSRSGYYKLLGRARKRLAACMREQPR